MRQAKPPKTTAEREAEIMRLRTLGPVPITKFARSQTTRVCNASSKESYQTPNWPSARASAADGIKSRGWA